MSVKGFSACPQIFGCSPEIQFESVVTCRIFRVEKASISLARLDTHSCSEKHLNIDAIMELWTAFIVGLFGSLHCAGMCGPIALALPTTAGSKLRLILGRLLYNIGRIVSYMTLGAIFGLLGQTISLAGLQQALSIGLGLILLVGVFMPLGLSRQLSAVPFFAMMTVKVRSILQTLFRVRSYESLLAIGFLNGLLPCGFVYVGLAGATSTGSILKGMAYMMLFGLGTVPMMLGIALMGSVLNPHIRQRLLRFAPVATVALALLFILRGLSLGIPYLSPQMSHQADKPLEEKVECCPSPVMTDSTQSDNDPKRLE